MVPQPVPGARREAAAAAVRVWVWGDFQVWRGLDQSAVRDVRHPLPPRTWERRHAVAQSGGGQVSTPTERHFEALATHVSREAANVDCTPAEYRDGLLTIIEMLKVDMQASKELDSEET